MKTDYCVLLWEKEFLHSITGPFKSNKEAKEWIAKQDKEFRAEVLPLWSPDDD
jgi:hypothetical protein